MGMRSPLIASQTVGLAGAMQPFTVTQRIAMDVNHNKEKCILGSGSSAFTRPGVSSKTHCLLAMELHYREACEQSHLVTCNQQRDEIEINLIESVSQVARSDAPSPIWSLNLGHLRSGHRLAIRTERFMQTRRDPTAATAVYTRLHDPGEAF